MKSTFITPYLYHFKIIKNKVIKQKVQQQNSLSANYVPKVRKVHVIRERKNDLMWVPTKALYMAMRRVR